MYAYLFVNDFPMSSLCSVVLSGEQQTISMDENGNDIYENGYVSILYSSHGIDSSSLPVTKRIICPLKRARVNDERVEIWTKKPLRLKINEFGARVPDYEHALTGLFDD